MTDCIEWQGWRDRDGYGRSHRWQGAHRVAWEKANGPIPDGLFVLHRCDNPPCVNVAHLFLGTNVDNARDRAMKGRSSRLKVPQPGEENGRAKLTGSQVAEIRALHAREGRKWRARPRIGVTRKDIATRFGVSTSTVDAILSGRNWKGGDATNQSPRRSASSGQGLVIRGVRADPRPHRHRGDPRAAVHRRAGGGSAVAHRLVGDRTVSWRHRLARWLVGPYIVLPAKGTWVVNHDPGPPEFTITIPVQEFNGTLTTKLPSLDYRTWPNYDDPPRTSGTFSGVWGEP